MCKQNCADVNLISYGNLLSCWQYIYRNVYLLIWYLASWSCPGSWWLTGWRQEGEMGSSEREQGVDGDGVSVSWLNCAVLELTGVMRKTVTHPLSLTLVWLTVHTSTVDASVLLQNIIRTRWRLWQKKKQKNKKTKKRCLHFAVVCMSRLSGFDLITSETGFNLCHSVNVIKKG